MKQQQFDEIRKSKGLAAAIFAYALFLLIACVIITGIFSLVIYTAFAVFI